MPRYWTSHWQIQSWSEEVNGPGPVTSSGSNMYRGRGVEPGDVMYIVSIRRGQLMLGGRMIVGDVKPREEFLNWLGPGDDNFYPAAYWVVGQAGSGTDIDFERRLAPEVTRRLRYIRSDGERPLFFTDADSTVLDRQATRGVCELTAQSAALLDQVIALTDGRSPRTPVTVTADHLRTGRLAGDATPAAVEYHEGEVRQEEVTRRGRNRAARDACVAHHGAVCRVCRFDFADAYGPDAAGLMHVHHPRPLADADGPRAVDPVADLRPVCPNCHAVIHRRDSPFRVDEVQAMLGGRVTRPVVPSSGPHGGGSP